jgi:hypothetical protein
MFYVARHFLYEASLCRAHNQLALLCQGKAFPLLLFCAVQNWTVSHSIVLADLTDGATLTHKPNLLSLLPCVSVQRLTHTDG